MKIFAGLIYYILPALILFPKSSAFAQEKSQQEASLEKRFENPIKVFPNPATQDITVEFGLPSTKGEIKIYTINGSEIHKQEIFSTEKIDISHLRDGFYFYEIINEGKIIHVGRLIKR